MDTKHILSSTGWTLREWERRTGLSINTLRKLRASSDHKPQRRTRDALAAALRNASRDFDALADQLEAD